MNHRKKGYLFVLLSALCFATGGLLIKINSWSSMSINGVRSRFALLIFYPYFRSIGHKFRINKMIIIGAYFGIFQALMPLIGYLLGTSFETLVTQIDHWIAFILLAIIGGNMIKEALGKDEESLISTKSA